MPKPLPDVPHGRLPWRVIAHALVPAASFLATLAAVRLLLAQSSTETRAAWAGWASTNVVNLLHHPVASLVTSAFVGTDDPTAWFMLGSVGLVTTGWRFGVWRTTVIVTAAHVIATYLSESLLAFRVLTHTLPAGQLNTEDLGPSYVLVAALSAGMAFGPTLGRLLCALGCAGIGPELLEEVGSLDMTAVGHVCAFATGAVVSYLLHQLIPYPSRTVQG